jgi:acetyl-CoA carboxylase carboxyltransferase component
MPCGKAYDPRFIYAWPTAKIAVMVEQAAKTMRSNQVANFKNKGQVIHRR